MLTKRLKAIANFIDENDYVIDVGCDHAFLDIYLTKHNKNTCVASDISEKVIKNAKNNIKKYKLDDKIKTVVSDGLDNVAIPLNSTIVISGMGTRTIIGILNKASHNNIKNLIIQSNNDLEILRKKIIKMGYIIEREMTILENKKFYQIIKFKKGYKKYKKKEYQYGINIIDDNFYKLYLIYLMNKNSQIIKKLPFKYFFKKYNLNNQNKYLKKYLEKNH